MIRPCLAGRCQVVVALFVTGPHDCTALATREVQTGGEWSRCCDRHLADLHAGEIVGGTA